MNFDEAFDKVAREYEFLRDEAARTCEARKEAIYNRVPALFEVDAALSRAGLDIARLVLNNDRPGFEAAREAITRLQQERKVLMNMNHITPDDFLPKHRCVKCSDTGRAQDGNSFVRFGCFMQRLIEENIALSNMKDVLARENFEYFDLRIFSDEAETTRGYSPRKNMENVYKLASRFVVNFGRVFENLLFFGGPGLGKSFTCHCIAHDLLKNGHTVLYQTAPRLIGAFEENRFGGNRQEKPFVLQMADDADLLILDDLGTEFLTVVTTGALFDLINHRLITSRPTIISTNLDPYKEFIHTYSERISSRLLGNYTRVEFFGKDQRI